MRIRGAHAAGVLFSARWPKTREREKRGLFGGAAEPVHAGRVCSPESYANTLSVSFLFINLMAMCS